MVSLISSRATPKNLRDKAFIGLTKRGILQVSFSLGPEIQPRGHQLQFTLWVNVFNVVYNVYGWLFGKLHLTIWSFGQSLMVLVVESVLVSRCVGFTS